MGTTRLIAAYGAELTRTRRDLAIAEQQRTDYAARFDTPFPHGAYRTELTELRNQLKAALTHAAERGTDIPAFAERIKTLTASQSIEAAPERPTPPATATAAEPVTTRLLHRVRESPPPEPVEQPSAPVTMAEPLQRPALVTPFQASQPSLFTASQSGPVRPKPLRRQRFPRTEPVTTVQLRLW